MHDYHPTDLFFFPARALEGRGGRREGGSVYLTQWMCHPVSMTLQYSHTLTGRLPSELAKLAFP